MPQLDEEISRIHERDAKRLHDSLVRATGGDHHRAEDIAQESWLRAVLSWPTHGLPERPGAWLRTVSRNILYNQHRRPRPLPLDAVDPGLLRADDIEALLESTETRAVVQSALQELPTDERQLIETFHFEGTPVAVIAERLGASERAVEGRLRRIRLRLRTLLEARGLTSRDLRSNLPILDLSLTSFGKVILMSALLPWLVIIAGYFVARRLASGRSPRRRAWGYLIAGLGLITLGTLEAPDLRALQLFGLTMLLLGSWKLWRLSEEGATA